VARRRSQRFLSNPDPTGLRAAGAAGEDRAMAYDEALADRIREALADRDDVTERKMFGGLAFMVGGNMCCGVIGSEAMLRLGEDGADAALDEPHTRPMDFTGRPMKGMVYVAPPGIDDEAAVRGWVERAVAFAGSLPPK
jgi:TfoX/Sxy family transcriptional regulator of competence genes